MMQLHASAFAGMTGLILFIVLFAIAVTYALWPSNKRIFDHLAHLPLNDDNEENGK